MMVYECLRLGWYIVVRWSWIRLSWIIVISKENDSVDSEDMQALESMD